MARPRNRPGRLRVRCPNLGAKPQAGATGVGREAPPERRSVPVRPKSAIGPRELVATPPSAVEARHGSRRASDYNERQHDEPPFRDKRDIATAIQALANTALKLAEYDKATGRDDEKSMLVELRQALMGANQTSAGP